MLIVGDSCFLNCLSGLCCRYRVSELADRMIWIGVYWGCEHFPKQQLDDGRELNEWRSNNTNVPFL